ncbi:uncharacterized protein LOC110828573 [Zootermopsis nevadensis]|uniref:uncharacterized protein LOC110828573 n=1 Tax=Zootermopsis nevadensis TaxID=136037 RepID=UPI000B8EE3DC|nr:uncharacterized protein LOC110828573 [Zootermopsis nevadensis]
MAGFVLEKMFLLARRIIHGFKSIFWQLPSGMIADSSDGYKSEEWSLPVVICVEELQSGKENGTSISNIAAEGASIMEEGQFYTYVCRDSQSFTTSDLCHTPGYQVMKTQGQGHHVLRPEFAPAIVSVHNPQVLQSRQCAY